MIYNPQLDTFIAVADAGSFNKASELLFISANALMKQINSLEKSLGFKLFERTHRGITLTKAGKSFYSDVKYIIQYSNDAVIQASNQADQQHLLKIGMSFTTPVEFLVSLWTKIQQINPYLKFALVPFENTPENARELMKNFGSKIDMVAGIYSKNLLQERNCSAFYLYDSPICCAVPIQHSFASRDKLTLKDLCNETLMMPKRHYLDDFDVIRNYLVQNYPMIDIKDIDFFSVDVFNQCVNENNIMLAVHEWKNIHPMLKLVPLECNYHIPFGIMYSRTPNPDMQLFLTALKKIYRPL